MTTGQTKKQKKAAAKAERERKEAEAKAQAEAEQKTKAEADASGNPTTPTTGTGPGDGDTTKGSELSERQKRKAAEKYAKELSDRLNKAQMSELRERQALDELENIRRENDALRRRLDLKDAEDRQLERQESNGSAAGGQRVFEEERKKNLTCSTQYYGPPAQFTTWLKSLTARQSDGRPANSFADVLDHAGAHIKHADTVAKFLAVKQQCEQIEDWSEKGPAARFKLIVETFLQWYESDEVALAKLQALKQETKTPQKFWEEFHAVAAGTNLPSRMILDTFTKNATEDFRTILVIDGPQTLAAAQASATKAGKMAAAKPAAPVLAVQATPATTNNYQPRGVETRGTLAVAAVTAATTTTTAVEAEAKTTAAAVETDVKTAGIAVEIAAATGVVMTITTGIVAGIAMEAEAKPTMAAVDTENRSSSGILSLLRPSSPSPANGFQQPNFQFPMLNFSGFPQQPSNGYQQPEQQYLQLVLAGVGQFAVGPDRDSFWIYDTGAAEHMTCQSVKYPRTCSKEFNTASKSVTSSQVGAFDVERSGVVLGLSDVYHLKACPVNILSAKRLRDKGVLPDLKKMVLYTEEATDGSGRRTLEIPLQEVGGVYAI
eukprot:g19977.t1